MKSLKLFIKEAFKISKDTKLSDELVDTKPNRRGKYTTMTDKHWAAAEEKMKAWHEGRRKQNLKTCSDEKLKMNLHVCKNLGFNDEIEQIKRELKIRGIDPQKI